MELPAGVPKLGPVTEVMHHPKIKPVFSIDNKIASGSMIVIDQRSDFALN